MTARLKRLRCSMFGYCNLHDAEIVFKVGLIAIESHIFYPDVGWNLKLRIPDSVKDHGAANDP